MAKLSVASLFLASTLLLAIGCGKDDTNPDYAANADCSAIVTADNTYTNSIKTILDTNCALSGCHNAATATNGVNLSDYASAKQTFETKDVLCAVHHGSGCPPMPKGGAQLANNLINQIDCWVKNGYAE
ncbi:MAG: hypothetical protein HY842_02090 [Bacteroidetes bacterium]|nr:hypothetical protein [Bacteroidota bacterium]